MSKALDWLRTNSKCSFCDNKEHCHTICTHPDIIKAVEIAKEEGREEAKGMTIHQLADLFKSEVMIVSTAEKKMIEDFRKGGWYFYKEDKQ